MKHLDAWAKKAGASFVVNQQVALHQIDKVGHCILCWPPSSMQIKNVEDVIGYVPVSVEVDPLTRLFDPCSQDVLHQLIVINHQPHVHENAVSPDMEYADCEAP